MSEPSSRLTAALADRYRIERELGQGGMATVYLAHDLRHDRPVALKVLKPELAAVVGAERFLAEIRTTANLQHPHILPLFDSGSADSFVFYVMPFVDGESLDARLQRERQLPVQEAVGVARSLAEALDYAHRKGVIHRDIKPANVMLLEGKPVIADFGIALAVGSAGGGRLTETGLSLGTPHYMSPEQATGDARIGPAADIYALGCVLYEMLAGEPPYTGSSAQAVLGKILTEPTPRVTRHRKSVPPNVEAVVGKALEKVPADRFTSAAELAKALGDPAFRHGEVGAQTLSGGRGRGLWKSVAAAVATTAVASAVLAATLWPRPAPAGPLTFSELPLSDSVSFGSTTNTPGVAISGDGSTVAFYGQLPGGRGLGLYLRDMAGLTVRPLLGAEGGWMPVFSPDGRSVLFQLPDLRLRRVSADGGSATTVADSASYNGLDWSENDEILFTRNDALWRVSAEGGTPVLLAKPDSARGHLAYRWPHALPGGKAALITLWKGTDALENAQLGVVSLADGTVTELGVAGASPRYAKSGHVFFVRADGTLLAAPFSLRKLSLTGDPVPVVDQVFLRAQGGADFALSTNGTLIYRGGGGSTKYEPVWVDRSGAAQEIEPGWTVEGSAYGSTLALSPDDRRLALSAVGAGGHYDLWIKHVDTGTLSRFTTDGNVNQRASWSPDGAFLTFVRAEQLGSYGVSDVLRARADGTGTLDTVLAGARVAAKGTSITSAALSSDGGWLVYMLRSVSGANVDVFGLRVGMDSVGTPLLATKFMERGPSLSPDGKWLAYSSNETGPTEVYVRPFPLVDTGKWTVSLGGGGTPKWAHNGRELFYLSAKGEMVAVETQTRPTFAPGRQSVLFRLDDFEIGLGYPVYDVSRDDQRFVMLRRATGGDSGSTLILVQNVLEHLGARPSPN